MRSFQPIAFGLINDGSDPQSLAMDVVYIAFICVINWAAGGSILKLFPGTDLGWCAKQCQANLQPTISDDGIICGFEG